MELSDSDFRTINDVMMITSIQGPALVMFYMPSCKLCQQLKPQIQQLAQQETRVRIAFANVTSYPGIARMASSTKTRIQKVPCFIFYHRGNPISRYPGQSESNEPPSVDGVMRCINSSLTRVQPSAPQTFMGPTVAARPGNSAMESAIYQQPRDKESHLNIPTEITPYTNPWMKNNML